MMRLLPEEIHREVMRLYLENGQRGLAARQYEVCCRSLALELDIAPMEETQALYAEIVGGLDRDGFQTRPNPATTDIRDADLGYLYQALQQVYAAIQSFEEGKEQLKRAIRKFEWYAHRTVQ